MLVRGLRRLALGAVLLLSGVAAGFALGSGPGAHAETGCNVEMTRGGYAVSGTGFIFGPPWAITGLVVFDGAGHATATVVESYGGVIDDATFEATYTMGPDCRGVMTVTHMNHQARAGGGQHVHWRQDVHRVEFVSAAGGQRIYWILVNTIPEAAQGAPEVPNPTVTASGLFERI